jgi:hypothetical protein
VLGRRYARVEAAWVQALPFPVRGYFRVLGETLAEERRVRVRSSSSAMPRPLARCSKDRRARDLPRHGPAHWRPRAALDGRERPLRTCVPEDSDPTNLQVLAWMRGMIDEVLVPLHDAYPLRGVEFEG